MANRGNPLRLWCFLFFPRYRYSSRFWLALLLLLLIVIVLYGIRRFSIVSVKPDTDRTRAVIVINFLLPMRQESLCSRLRIAPEIPKTGVICETEWLGPTTLVLRLQQQGEPQGQLLKFQIDRAPTIIPFISKSVTGKVRPPVPIRLMSKVLADKIPSRGPVPIVFNTPVNLHSLKRSVVLPIPGDLTPLRLSVDGKSFTDYSRWQYTPEKPFQNDTTYRIIIKAGLRSMGGSVLNGREEIAFTTARKPKVVSTNPRDGERKVHLYRTIEFVLDQEISSACVKVISLREGTSVPGNTEVKQGSVVFRPAYSFLPNTWYKAVLQAESAHLESLDKYKITFTTLDLGNKYWVDVKLGERHTATVYKGSKVVRRMPVSGGRPDSPTPLGCFYTQDRGHAFWSARFGEGATYWVRLVGQVLIHSVPKDHRWKTKEEEHAKLGLPASHGCIRMDEKDAKWFFENIPRGTMVIIHH